MAKGNSIVLAEEPRGRFVEGTITGTPKPGTIMQIDVSEGLNYNGRPTYEVYTPGTDGNRRMIAVLLPDELLGKTATDAYANGDHGFLYIPAVGEELNVLFGNVSGTADDVAFGDLMIVVSGSGKVIPTTGSPESEPFQALEAITDPTADQLLHVIFTGY